MCSILKLARKWADPLHLPRTIADTMVDPQHTSSGGFFSTFINFIRTQKAILLLLEITFCIVILCCFLKVEYYYLSGAELALGILFFIIYSFSLNNNIQWLSWPWCDFLRTFTAAFLYLISSIPALASRGNRYATLEGSAGLCAVCLFGYDAAVSFPLRQ